MKLIDNPKGNYQFLTGIAPYSSGVVAMPGFEIVHTRFMRPVPLHLALERVQSHLEKEERTISALCGMELRIPAPLSFEGFIQFNQEYGKKLQELELLLKEVNPIARTNISLVECGPEEASMYAFSYTVPSSETAKTFIVAGAGDLIDQGNLTKEAIVRSDEVSPDALREKIVTVMKVMKARLDGLEVGWSSVTNIDVYTAIPMEPYLLDLIIKPSGLASQHSINWYFSNPPIQGLIFEMDLRGVRRDLFIEG